MGRLSTALLTQQQQISSEKRALETVRNSILQMQSQTPGQQASEIVSENFRLQGQNAFLRAQVVSLQAKLSKFRDKLKSANEKLVELLHQKKRFGWTQKSVGEGNPDFELDREGSYADPNHQYTTIPAHFKGREDEYLTGQRMMGQNPGYPMAHRRNMANLHRLEQERMLATGSANPMVSPGRNNLGMAEGSGGEEFGRQNPRFVKTHVGVTGANNASNGDWRFQSERKLSQMQRNQLNVSNSNCRCMYICMHLYMYACIYV